MNSALDVLEFGKYINVPGPVGVVFDVASQGIPDLELNLTVGQRFGRISVAIVEGQFIGFAATYVGVSYGAAAFATGPGSAVAFTGTYMVMSTIVSLALEEINETILFPWWGLSPGDEN
jgi:hypothetical protein